MKGFIRLHFFLVVIAVSVFAIACETIDPIYYGAFDTAVDTALPDAPIDNFGMVQK